MCSAVSCESLSSGRRKVLAWAWERHPWSLGPVHCLMQKVLLVWFSWLAHIPGACSGSVTGDSAERHPAPPHHICYLPARLTHTILATSPQGSTLSLPASFWALQHPGRPLSSAHRTEPTASSVISLAPRAGILELPLFCSSRFH